MCGIFGIFKNVVNDDDIQYASLATKLMEARGPDDEGFFSDTNCVLGFRRLSIIDLSNLGHQPMSSNCGSYILVFNGELYNYLELREELVSKGIKFKSTSDSEVVLQAIILWKEEAFKKFNGMFALGFYNRIDKNLIIARDHVGMKPLYYYNKSGNCIFASQLNQLLAYKGINLNISDSGMSNYVSFGYNISPNTIFEEIKILKPGTALVFSLRQTKHVSFFDIGKEITNANTRNIEPDFGTFNSLLDKSVARHLLSDVKVGTFLSGGLDSAIITGKAASQYSNLTAFTLSNSNIKYDESQQAAKIAKCLKINHITVAAEDYNIKEIFKEYILSYSEPFGDYSGIPSLLISRVAKDHGIKVLLSGDGADELFYGYSRVHSRIRASKFYVMPLIIRRMVNKFSPISSIYLKDSMQMTRVMEQISDDLSIGKIYKRDTNFLNNPFCEERSKFNNYEDWLRSVFITHYFQAMTNKVDRATMSHGVESRMPFMDKDFMLYALNYSYNNTYNLKTKEYKIPLRKLFHEMYPSIPSQTAKMGFSIPMEDWLTNQLSEILSKALAIKSTLDETVNFNEIRQRLKMHSNILDPGFIWTISYLKIWWLHYIDNMEIDDILDL